MRLVYVLFLTLPLTLHAQFTYTLDQTVPVEDLDGNLLRLPWAGGLNAAQFNTMDLNGDGTEDLVLYDRMANKVITFIAEGNTYVPAPEYENHFPTGVYNWLLLRDYNGDGKKDIFTGDVLGMKVFLNVTNPGEIPEWEPYLFSNGFGGKSNVLLTKNPSTGIKVNLQLQYDDLPSISDVDGDGDIDIFNIQYAGFTVEFHQNLSVENYNSADSLEFLRVTRSWGDFRECDCGVFAFDGDDCPPASGGRTKHAGGKSLLAIDINADQQQDLLFSEAECTQLFALRNKGTLSDPVIDDALAFPQNSPVNFFLFPAGFYEDVDFDGIKDLIATPNIYYKEYLNSQLNQSTWFYKNTGSNNQPEFTFVQRDFLQGEMIDVGDNAVPAFGDHNGDGLLDLIISSHSSDAYTSRLYLFQNVGSAANPAFKLVSDDYLGFRSSKYYNVKIQLSDMDGNGTRDLIFTATNFESEATGLYYLPNNSQTSLDFAGSPLRPVNFALTSSENIYVIDLSGDGLPDILAGRSEGNLEYWKNTGTKGSPAFALEAENFLGYNASPLRQDLTVAVADLDRDGNNDMLIGDQTGRIAVISNFRDVVSAEEVAEYNLIFNNTLGTYRDKNLGGKIWPVVVNLFNADRPAIVAGNSLGGIHIMKHDLGQSLPEIPRIDVYPNPASREESLKILTDRHGTMEIYSALGQRVGTVITLKPLEAHEYRLNGLSAGMYLLKFRHNNRSYVRRFVVR